MCYCAPWAIKGVSIIMVHFGKIYLDISVVPCNLMEIQWCDVTPHLQGIVHKGTDRVVAQLRLLGKGTDSRKKEKKCQSSERCAFLTRQKVACIVFRTGFIVGGTQYECDTRSFPPPPSVIWYPFVAFLSSCPLIFAPPFSPGCY